MPHYHVSDFGKPDRFDPVVRREVLDEAREAVKEMADRNGLLHVSDVLALLDGRTL